MFGGDGLTSDLEFDRKKGGFTSSAAGGGSWQFAQSASFQDGEYDFRFAAPDPAKCPRGYRVIRYHEVETTPGTKVQILHPSSCIPAQTGPSYIEEILQLFTQIPNSKIPDSLTDVLNSLALKTRYLFPTFWRATPFQDREFTNYKPGQSMVGVIWDVRAPTLVEKISIMSKMFPEASDVDKGRWFRFRKARYDYNIAEGLQEPLPSDCQALMSRYPNLNGMFAKWQADRLKQMALLKAAWYSPMIEKFIALTD